ncbi:metallophosphoesterase [Stratiformator vulcanicus]|uniref:Putative metallophosphoesterase n=1 Tax=Stratiformator vulcanicus TaxID=2527980 RepID=A0A517R5D6_9PLAN|nr:metallophosphoesterase [Stratiformator vulcanicus]QDT39082.1 putative metallophosphoesterase [Stratiformator vulcanicus]
MYLLSIPILLLLAIGHAAFLAACINRYQGFAHRGLADKLGILIHFAAMFGVPIAFLILERPWEPEFASRFAARPSPFWTAYAGFCIGGLVSLAIGSLRNVTRSRPRAVVDEQQELVVPPPPSLGEEPTGIMGRIARLPGNESRTFEVLERTLAIRNLPKAFDGLRIVQLSDSHFLGGIDLAFFEAVCERVRLLAPDLLVFTGDLIDDLDRLDWLPKTFGRLEAPLGRYFILGNHDWRKGPQAVRESFERVGWTNVAGRVVTIDHNGSAIAIGGDERPWMGEIPPIGDTAAEFRLLLAHTPDRIGFAQRSRVDLMLAGHNHGGQIRFPILGPIYSPSRFGTRYSGGCYEIGRTLMCVSRGLSGQIPLRYGCPPELSAYKLQPE